MLPAIDAELAELTHLNLEGCLSGISPIMKACGVYSDVFIGTLHRKDSCIKVRVAVKRLRIHLKRDPSFAKVRVMSKFQ